MKVKSFRDIKAIFPLTGDTEIEIKNLLYIFKALWNGYNKYIKAHQRARGEIRGLKKGQGN